MPSWIARAYVFVAVKWPTRSTAGPRTLQFLYNYPPLDLLLVHCRVTFSKYFFIHYANALSVPFFHLGRQRQVEMFACPRNSTKRYRGGTNRPTDPPRRPIKSDALTTDHHCAFVLHGGFYTKFHFGLGVSKFLVYNLSNWAIFFKFFPFVFTNN